MAEKCQQSKEPYIRLFLIQLLHVAHLGSLEEASADISWIPVIRGSALPTGVLVEFSSSERPCVTTDIRQRADTEEAGTSGSESHWNPGTLGDSTHQPKRAKNIFLPFIYL